MTTTTSEFKAVFSDAKWSDAFYKFLQVVFHLYPEDKFHHLIAEVSCSGANDGEIYREVQRRLPEIKPFASEVTYALPALKKQKHEMRTETLELLDDVKRISGYLEIGSTGRYISDLRKYIEVESEIYLINDVAPDNSPGEIFERGQLAKLGCFHDLNNYQPITAAQIPDESVDLVTLFIGFHHCPQELFPGFLRSIRRVLRPSGSLILREHNVTTPEMSTFVSLVHTVFNLGLKVPWEKNKSEHKSFRTIDEWSALVVAEGFTDSGKRLYQPNDPSDNALVRLVRK
jgi:SAM-dependent methyltransferase